MLKYSFYWLFKNLGEADSNNWSSYVYDRLNRFNRYLLIKKSYCILFEYGFFMVTTEQKSPL